MPRSGERAGPGTGDEVYAIQRPSGEKTDPIGSTDCTPPNGAAVLSATETVHSANVEPFATENDTSLPSGDQDSGTCVSPCAGFVRRSTEPVPSVRCQ